MRLFILLAAVALVVPVPALTQSPAASEHGPLVIGARSYSPMVENVDLVMKFYATLGLKAPPPEKGDSYPWDEEAWHYELHGAGGYPVRTRRGGDGREQQDEREKQQRTSEHFRILRGWSHP